MGQTTRGFTYADQVDTVGDFPATSQVQAEEVNDHVGRHAAGTVTIATGSSGSFSQAVSFPAGRFSAAGPSAVVCTVSNGNPGAGTTNWTIAWGSGISSSGCTINVRCNWNAGSVTVHWHAVEV